MFRSRVLLSIVILAPSLVLAQPEQPRLVLQVTVDGLRADLIERYRDNFDGGGFNYLLDEGAVFHNAQYLHANTETIVGHTTLATGATPAVHGMVGNVWYHADTGELGYNIEDPDAPLLPTRQTPVTGAQVDPAQLRAQSKGRSPRGILVPTFSDTLTVSTGGKAKVFGISSKDRSAVAMAGHTGTAYWYSTDSGDFQTSSYYMDTYPEWVNQWNRARLAEKLGSQPWELLLPPESYLHRTRDDRPYEVDLKGYGRTFPHDFGSSDHPLFFTRLLVSPQGDRLLLDFGKTLIVAEELGQDEVTDYLSISFSGVDAVNHFFGPGSLENEDTVIQLDRTLAELFEFIDQRIGLDKVLIVLSADHGIAEMPEFAAELGYPAGRLYSDEVLTTARQAAETLFGDPSLVKDFFRPYLYLDRAEIRSAGLKHRDVAASLARSMEGLQGISAAVTVDEAMAAVGTGAESAVRHNLNPERAGDIYLYQEPYWFMFDRGAVAAMHGSPWAYDRHVPIIFAGVGIGAASHNRLVHPIDVAPTLSAILHLPPPAGAQGTALKEVLTHR